MCAIWFCHDPTAVLSCTDDSEPQSQEMATRTGDLAATSSPSGFSGTWAQTTGTTTGTRAHGLTQGGLLDHQQLPDTHTAVRGMLDSNALVPEPKATPLAQNPELHYEPGTPLESAIFANAVHAAQPKAFDQSVSQGLGTVKKVASATTEPSDDRRSSAEAERLLTGLLLLLSVSQLPWTDCTASYQARRSCTSSI